MALFHQFQKVVKNHLGIFRPRGSFRVEGHRQQLQLIIAEAC
nr:hypothetical protein [Lactobacillus delbrueckii]